MRSLASLANGVARRPESSPLALLPRRSGGHQPRSASLSGTCAALGLLFLLVISVQLVSACPSFGCDGYLSFSLPNPLPTEPLSQVAWRYTASTLPANTALQCASAHDRIVCSASFFAGKTTNSGSDLASSSSSPSSPSSASATNTLLSLQLDGVLAWNNSFLLPSPAFPFLDPVGDTFVSDGRFLLSLGPDGAPLAPKEEIEPSLFPLLQTPTLTDNSVLMFGSLSGFIAGYLTDGTPFASHQLNSSWPRNTTLPVVPLTPFTIFSDRIYFVATEKPSRGLCVLSAYDVTRSMARRLTLAWQHEFHCDVDAAETGEQRQQQEQEGAAPFMYSAPRPLVLTGDTDTLVCTASLASTLACFNDTGSHYTIFSPLNFSSPIQSLALLTVADEALIAVGLHNSSTIVLVSIVTTGQGNSSLSIKAKVDLCAVFPSSSSPCLRLLPTALLSSATLASGNVVLMGIAHNATTTTTTSTNEQLAQSDPSSAFLFALDASTLKPVFLVDLGPAPSGPASQIVSTSVTSLEKERSTQGKSAAVAVAIGNTLFGIV